jgi:flagellar hook protein FlgE
MKALHRRMAATVLVASLVVLVPVLVPATAAAETKTYTFNISGTEVAATSTTGRFVGTASGSAFGTWYAEVIHDPLGGRANIRPGGSFGMALHQAEPAYVVSGQFSGGTITVNNSGANCTNQVYTVDGYLRNVSVTRTGHVVATLTHHRKSVLGRCWLYAATVGGTVTLA